MLKRGFDIMVSLFAIILLSPLLLVIAAAVGFTSPGGVLYVQKRVGRNNREFNLYKFRTMRTGADKSGLLTVGGRDPRITKVGYFLRKYKVDELPQLFNVLFGSMSLVGPRPEVRKYVSLYTAEDRQVLTVKPGITDFASLEYFSENELLAQSADPEGTYIHDVMPEKLRLNRKYIREASFTTDIKILFRTVKRIFS
jgi:lipopolysaccharide/colanic/teichoic acid biosynthesis glycosyltransferase